MSSKLKHALSHPVPIPVASSSTGNGVAIDTVMVQPRVLIRAAAEILLMLAGDDPDEFEEKLESKLIKPDSKLIVPK